MKRRFWWCQSCGNLSYLLKRWHFPADADGFVPLSLDLCPDCDDRYRAIRRRILLGGSR